jgi:hypothetical protein
MDVTLPAWATPMLDLTGIPWINVDADKVDQQASAMTAAAAAMRPAAEQAGAQVRHVTEQNTGEAADSLGDRWRTIGIDAAGVAGLGALGVGLMATKAGPVVLHGFAHIVRGSKLATVSQLASGMARTSAAAITGGPLGQATALASTKLAVARIRHTLTRGVTEVLTPAMRRHVTEPFAKVLGVREPAGALAGDAGIGAMRTASNNSWAKSFKGWESHGGPNRDHQQHAERFGREHYGDAAHRAKKEKEDTNDLIGAVLKKKVRTKNRALKKVEKREECTIYEAGGMRVKVDRAGNIKII